MWNEPTKERLSKIPKLYETEHVPLKEKLIYRHFFIGDSDWFICEFDGEDLMWGFCILGGDLINAEWGYVSFNELKTIKINGWLEIDCEHEEYFPIQKALEIDKIRVANGWLIGNDNQRKCIKEDELIMKVKAGHFQDFQDLFSEVTSPYSDFYGIDPYPVWEVANGL